MPVISKRKLESYKRAEKVAQEARRQCAHPNRPDPSQLAVFVIHWMAVTGEVKYQAPAPPKSRFKFQ